MWGLIEPEAFHTFNPTVPTVSFDSKLKSSVEKHNVKHQPQRLAVD
jgi:hypothetical protein